MALHRLTRIVVGVPDVAAASEFYTDFGLTPVGEGRFATIDGGEQLHLVQRPDRGLVELGIGCDDPDDIARLVSRLDGSGFTAVSSSPTDVSTSDPASGVAVRVSVSPHYSQAATDAPPTNGPGHEGRLDARAPGVERSARVQPRKLGHVVIGSTDVEGSERLFIDILGFEVSDVIRHAGKFVRCSTDHHNLMVSPAPVPFLHHTSWQVDDVDEIGRGATQVLAGDPERHAWGLGRHNVGSNFFWYFRDPAGNLAEYYSDLDIITEAPRWRIGEWEPRASVAAWGPRPPRGFFTPDAPPRRDVAAGMAG